MRRLSVALIGVLIAAVPSLGSAHAWIESTNVSIRYVEASDAFRGRVKSGRSFCIRGRRVKVVREVRGGREFVGRTHSDSEGRWLIPEPNARGRYRALVGSRTYRTEAPEPHHHECDRGKSDILRVP